MSIRAPLHGGNARHPVSSNFLAFLRDRGSRGPLSLPDSALRGSFVFSLAKVAAPIALVAGLVVAGSAQRGPSPMAALAEPGAWQAAAVPVATAPVAAATPVAAAAAVAGPVRTIVDAADALATDPVTSMPAAAPGTALP